MLKIHRLENAQKVNGRKTESASQQACQPHQKELK
jgi:hypothetical protein